MPPASARAPSARWRDSAAEFREGARDGEVVGGGRPDTFRALPESLAPAAKAELHRRIERARPQVEYEGVE
ncbi:hypothetical protein [Streptomyces roseoverticillatus]|uniref:Uncharacterized protein n=1 Tax=Streptomyces roseoverticillatus TaxID=66429 RepID=A0ABV3IYP5_9ACTN